MYRFQHVGKGFALGLALIFSLWSAGSGHTLKDDKTMKAKITVQVDRPGPTISPLLYGIFFEEINRAGEGGLWSEMLQNISFEDDEKAPMSWSSSGPVTAILDRTNPLNDRNPTSLCLDFSASGGRVTNRGFSREASKDRKAFEGGLALRAGAGYRFSLYQRGETALEVRLKSKTGKVLAKADIPSPGVSWQKVEVTLKPSASVSDGKLELVGKGVGKVWVDYVSLMPVDTWKGHGLRRDLAEKVAAMHPAFVRFPGGCYVEGSDRANALRWKDTVGDPAGRRGVSNLWGYKTTGAFGVHELLQWCEDLGAEPLYVINCGMGHGYSVPMGEMKEWVQDALDLVEYARGPVTSKWGALRAAAGHPEPFKLNYMEIGNENGGSDYNKRYALFYDAIKKKYPDLHLIADNWSGGIPDSRKVEIQDDHYYTDTPSFLGMAEHYKGLNPKAPRVYVGEYAVTNGAGTGNLNAALGEAVFLTGLEAAGDAVAMSSYAPLFVHPAWKAWNPNAVVFDQSRSYGTPSYHLQTMFASNRGDIVCPIHVDQPEISFQPPKGRFGVGAWATQVEYKDITFTTLDGKRVFTSDFSQGLKGWKPVKGQWKVQDGALRQIGDENAFAVAEIEGSNWGDGVYEVKARKIKGADGFQIQFQAEQEGQQRVWNLGGWGNTCFALQNIFGEPKKPGGVKMGRWYDIRLVLDGPKIQCFLDGKMIQEEVRSMPRRIYAVAGRSREGHDLFLKVVNVGDAKMETTFDLKGLKSVDSKAKALMMTSKSMDDENSFSTPNKVVPVPSVKMGVGRQFTCKLPAHSITVLRLSVDR